MQLYLNRSGNSGVEAFDIGNNYIRVRFNTGRIYLYNYQSAGKGNIEKMKIIATSGIGLCTFINKNVRHLYSSST